MRKPINITLFRWAGSWGPFKVKIPCGECSLTEDVIMDCIERELNGIDVEFHDYEWLTNWWKPLKKGGWHAPIVLVNGKLVSQGIALNRGILTQTVIEEAIEQIPLEGSHVFGKDTCPHCSRAKDLIERNEISANYHNVIQDTRALYEMIARVKPLIGAKTPVTLPQVWIDGNYVGGADSLEKFLEGK